MLGSGVATGMVIILKVQSAIPLVQKRAQTAWNEAAVGAAGPIFVGRRSGTGAFRRTATLALASALP